MNADKTGAFAAGSETARRHFAVLDGLRGIAALAVVQLHATDPFAIDFIPHAYLAVDFFFALSGFVIAFAYDERLKSGLTFAAFARARMIRLYPLLFLGFMLGAAVTLLRMLTVDDMALGALTMAVVYAVLLLPFGHVPGGQLSVFPLNGPAWSLFFELIANFIYAATARFLSKTVLAVVVALGALGIVASAATYNMLDVGDSLPQFGSGVARVMFSFFAGVLVFKLYAEGRFRRLPRIGALWLAALLLAALAAPVFAANWLYEALVVILFFPLIIALGSHDSISTSLTRWALIAGQLSYAVYILHYPLVRVFSNILRHHPDMSGLQIFLFIVLEIGVILMLAFMALKLFDEPVRRFLTERFARRRRKADIGPVGETR